MFVYDAFNILFYEVVHPEICVVKNMESAWKVSDKVGAVVTIKNATNTKANWQIESVNWQLRKRIPGKVLELGRRVGLGAYPAVLFMGSFWKVSRKLPGCLGTRSRTLLDLFR